MGGLTINVDLNKKCAECRKGGAVASGICLGCTAKAINGRPMKSAAGQAVALRFKEQKPARAGKEGE